MSLRWPLAALLALCLGHFAHADEEDTEIQYLLRFVAASDCIFERNGTRHAAEDAAEHLRLKYRRGRRYAATAEHFIDRLASASSWTNRVYTVECAGQVRESGDWLHQALNAYRAAGGEVH